jgi:hypothetical protein
MTGQPGSSPWICPGCNIAYKIPAGRRPPAACPACRKAAEEREALRRRREEQLQKLCGELLPPKPPPEKPTGTAADPEHFAPAPTALPASFVRIIEQREPARPWRAAGLLVRRCWPVLLVGTLAATGMVAAIQRAYRGQAELAAMQAAAKAPERVTDARVFEVVQPLVRETLIAGPTAEFSPNYVVNWEEDFGHGEQSCSIGGTLKVRNKFGVLQEMTWEVTGDARHAKNEFAYNEIKLNGIVAQQSPQWQEFAAAAALLFGNTVSDPPPEIGREILRVAAIAEDEVQKQLGTSPFELEWPDDPSRSGLRIMVDGTGNWRVDGQVKRYGSSKKLKVQGHFERHSGKVVRLYLGSKWVVGAAPASGP